MVLLSREDSDSGTSGVFDVDLDYVSFVKSDIIGDKEEVADHTSPVDINDDFIHHDGRIIVMDHEYKMFLANLEEDGTSYVVQLTDGPVNYEKQGSSGFGYIGRSPNFRHIGTDLPAESCQRIFQSAETEKNTDGQKRATDVLGKRRIEKPISNISGAENIENQQRKSPAVGKKDELNNADPISSWTSKDMSKKPKLKHHFNEGVSTNSEPDLDWLFFLKEIDERGQQVMLSGVGANSPDLKTGEKDVDKTGQPVTLNKDGQNSSDLNIGEKDVDQTGQLLMFKNPGKNSPDPKIAEKDVDKMGQQVMFEKDRLNSPHRKIGEKDVDKTGQAVMFNKAGKNSPAPKITETNVDKMGQQVMSKKARLNSPDCKIDDKDEDPLTELTFREKLMNALRKPYDDEECDDLWRQVHIRKPAERHRESRSGRIKPVVLSSLGKSHLDKDPRLAMEVEKVQNDRRKLLYVLRGYFFWLEFSPMEGSFAPWCDRECLKMMSS